MQTWTIANQKGGVGKTTTTLALGHLLVRGGRRVLQIDLDPHGSLTRAHGVPVDPAPTGALDLFAEQPRAIAEVARSTPLDGLDLVAAQPALATLERRGATQPGLGRALSRALAELSGYDVVLLDCPPTLGLLMVNALAAADRLIVPTQTDPLALHGLEGMLRTADMIERSRSRALPTAVVPTLHDRRTRAAQDTLVVMRERHGAHVWPDEIPLDTRLRDAAGFLDPDLRRGRGLRAYDDLLDWLLEGETAQRDQVA
ncbi:ParA family protein [Coralloluteibacterium stylophorae]|uniref:ParA family protein n=1 Tax=Coralloluteibacterium stylophorae TaxID=1776034 RepID=A0A8J8AZN7_9GAMM|nr:ParA family protein [Coralloluteibacterium stylophorae]MBS7457248.1 ParA family protein [Coralloluteibacterium stylophorae]